MFLFKNENKKKENKTKQNKNLFLLQIDTCSRRARECPMGHGSHAGLSKESLIIICKIVHLPFQINFNLKQGFYGNPRLLPVGCIPSAGGGQACSQMPRSPAKTRLLPQLKWPFFIFRVVNNVYLI